MTLDEIKELIHVLQETGIAELEVQRGENRVRIRSAAALNKDVVFPTMYPVAVGSSPAPAIPNQEQLPTPAAPAAREDERDTIVKSPIVGTYYDAPAPGSPTFVKVGDRVEPKQVLCIIESMKLMNEIEAESTGTVMAAHVENGRPVEYGESLFTIRPL